MTQAFRSTGTLLAYAQTGWENLVNYCRGKMRIYHPEAHYIPKYRHTTRLRADGMGKPGQLLPRQNENLSSRGALYARTGPEMAGKAGARFGTNAENPLSGTVLHPPCPQDPAHAAVVVDAPGKLQGILEH
jgi:hypothetical protein